MTDSYSRTADLICQTHFSVFLSFCCSTLVTGGCHDLLEALSLTRVSDRVRVDIAKDKKLQNLPEPVKSAPSWAAEPGHGRPRRAVLTTQFRLFYSSRLSLATSHCPSTAMSKFFTFNIF